jgi:hypothetical protein
MLLKNLTPHTLNIHTPDGVIECEPSGVVARVETVSEPADALISESGWFDDVAFHRVEPWAAHDIPTVRTTHGAVTGLPEFKQGTWLVVSGMVASACPRPDVFSPGDLVRDEKGRPCGCKGLRRSC